MIVLAENLLMCKDGMPCDSPLVDEHGRPACVLHFKSTLRMKGGSDYYCSRIQLKGGQGWGMPLREKLERQGLLKEYGGGEK
jgi:hypothetical protein